MTVQAEFEKKFHSISGITIGERSKNLHGLLNEVKCQQNEIDFASITPKTALEEVFKVETLLFFRKTDDLLKVLYQENSVVIKRVLKASHWFINSAFENVNGDELVTNVFPNISYNTKLKLLHKFARFSPNVRKSDEYFETINKNYGLLLATRFLESCSENLILRCLEEYRVEITPRQLLMIIKRYPKITESVLELLEKQNFNNSNNDKYRNVFVHLFQNDSALFLKLYRIYKPDLTTFGSRSTKAFIAQNKDYVIKNSSKMHRILNFKQTYKSIKSDYDEYLYNMFPKSLNEFQDNYSQYFYDLDKTSLSKPKQFDMLVKVFEKSYGNEIWNFPSLVTSELLELMSPDDREVWMQNHLKPDKVKEETWISLMKTKKSIPSLIEKISMTSNVSNRGELIITLLSTCKINNDLDALLRVLEYVTKKHRNDDVDTRGLFLYEVCHKFDVEKFSEEHWKYLMKLTRSYLLDKNYASWYVTDVFNGYINYCCSHEVDIYDVVLEWVKLSTDVYSLCQKVPEYEKSCLQIIAKTIPKVFIKKDELATHYRWYLSAVELYNERNPKDKISFFEDFDAIQNFKEHMIQEPYLYWQTENVVKKCLKFEYNRSLEIGLVEVYFNNIENKHNSIFRSILKNDPETFAKDVLPVLPKCCELYDLRYLKYYEHLGLPQKFSETYVSSDNSLMDSDSLKADQLHCLSYTMKPKDFVSLVGAYCSGDLVTTCETDIEEDICKVKEAAILCLQNLTPPEVALESLLQFCQGDYLKLAIGSLHSLCGKLNENKIPNVANILDNRDVSVRKHSIHLVFRFLNKKAIYEFLTKLMKNEKDMTIRKYLLKVTFKLFLNTQEQCDFELVKENVKAIDLQDIQAYTVITNNIKKISPKYFEELILFIWNILENAQTPDKAIVRRKCRILSAIDEKNISSLPEEFCKRLIQNYLFKSKEYEDLETDIKVFASRYIIYRKMEDLDNRIQCVLSIVQSYVQTNWYNMETYKTGRIFISNFVVEFCENFLSRKCINEDIIELFLKIWSDLFKPFEIYNEFLHLNFTALYVKSFKSKSSMLEIGETFGKFCNDLDSKGHMNIIIFCNVFETFKSNFVSIFEDLDPNESFLLMAEGILAKNSTSAGFVLAMFLLPDVTKLTSKNTEKYKKIFNQIIGQKKPDIQILLHQYFSNKMVDDVFC